MQRFMMIKSEMRQQGEDYDPDCECESCIATAERRARSERMVHALVGDDDDSSDDEQ